ncbi:hypothetical protein Flavo103_17930 [Flavobacterium collinsii]|nr:hypothetical protein Flavo103_17930 [Flavobacterium collinsii]
MRWMVDFGFLYVFNKKTTHFQGGFVLNYVILWYFLFIPKNLGS